MAETSAADGPSHSRLVYDGSTGELFVLWLKILGLNIITLGFYRFWGRTRFRKYLWSHVSLLGERLEYDGTGLELFLRFLVALVIFVPLLSFAPLLVWLTGGGAWGRVAQAVQVLVLIYLSFFAVYAGRRYRTSRTLWRGIRGGLDGSGNRYALTALAYAFLAAITLSLALPWRYVGLWRYVTNNTGFGDQQFHFEGSGRALLRPYFAALGLTLAALLLLAGAGVGLFFAVNIGQALSGKAPPTLAKVATLVAFGVLLYFFLLVLGAFAYAYFNARALGYVARNTRFGDVSFSAEVRVSRLLWLNVGNLLITIATLGLGAPFTAHRYVRFFCDNLALYGAEHLEALSQTAGRRRPKGGEGLVQLFDSGGFA